MDGQCSTKLDVMKATVYQGKEKQAVQDVAAAAAIQRRRVTFRPRSHCCQRCGKLSGFFDAEWGLGGRQPNAEKTESTGFESVSKRVGITT
ncbi:MAG: hypothetical protein ACI8UO_005193, partial [Verrucomicrobiales bacterium]